MPRKTILVAGATGLVGYAAMKHFGREAGTRIIALSRRRPDVTFGAEWLPLDLGDAPSCHAAAAKFRDVTHLVYAALYERPGLVAGWQDDEQILLNEAMLRNLFEPLQQVAPGLRHVALLQGTKAYGVHVRPMKVPARENRSEMHEQKNFYWNQERYIRDAQAQSVRQGRTWSWSILRPVLIVGEAIGGAMNLIPALGVHAALMRAHGMIAVAESVPALLVDAVHFDENARAQMQVMQAGRKPVPLTDAESSSAHAAAQAQPGDFRSDIYSMGLILYEMFCGRRGSHQ